MTYSTIQIYISISVHIPDQTHSTFILQGVELPKADGARTVQHVDSLKQDVHDRDEEIRRLTSLLETKKEVAQGRGGGGGGGGGGEEAVELSDLKAKLEEEKDRRMRSEEKLKNLQVCASWLS